MITTMSLPPRSPPDSSLDGHTSLSFPQEIWWLVARELASRLDFGSLFLCSRLSKGIAKLALPLLYAIHDQSPAINAHILGIEASVGLWRSIIASSLGKTLFPYCCWIKALKLGNLHSHLEDLARDNAHLKARFFSPPLEHLQIRHGRGRVLDLDEIVVAVANSVTEYIRTSANEQDKRVGITSLEGFYIPSDNLSTWVSSLSCLTSLSVRDGHVLNSSVGHAIRANCPAFREVECYVCTGMDVDDDMAGFVRSLEPNTLESFTILSMNDIGVETFKALCAHSSSLKILGLLSLERLSFLSLGELRDCCALESLKLECVRRYATDSCPQQVVDWLQKCTALRELEFTLVPESTTALAMVLKTPDIRLQSLSLKTFDMDVDFFLSLTNQTRLRHLMLKIVDEQLLDDGSFRHELFRDMLISCHELRELDTNELFTFEDVDVLCASLPLLEHIVLNGDLIDDAFLDPISRLSKLKSLTIFGPSSITPAAFFHFLDKLGADSEGDHDGLQIYLANQNHESKFTDDEEAMAAAILSESFRGQFDITYMRDPGELHESDFSD